MTDTIEPIRKERTVRCAPEEAFRLFTEGINRWWPVATHSISRRITSAVVLECRQDERLFERAADGEEHDWGRVLAYEPPERLVLSWHPGRDADTAQEVELRFEPMDDGTRVQLEHRGWDKLGRGRARDARPVRGWLEQRARRALRRGGGRSAHRARPLPLGGAFLQTSEAAGRAGADRRQQMRVARAEAREAAAASL